jgi:hypothetical protein
MKILVAALLASAACAFAQTPAAPAPKAPPAAPAPAPAAPTPAAPAPAPAPASPAPPANEFVAEKTVAAQPSWVIATKEVELAITKSGGHMAPVTFFRDTDKPVQPYHISPWQEEGLKLDGVLRTLRGDWFCMPFGANAAPFNKEQHPGHGEVASAAWQMTGANRVGGITTLTLQTETKVRPGKVTRELSLIEGQNVVYSREVIEGFAGPAPLGHHATLAMPETEGVVHIATSPIKFGMTNPSLFSDPVQREYQSFAIGARITSLKQVPLIIKGAPDADVSRLPARRGFADLVQLCNEKGDIAWTTATRVDQGWVWFALKDPEVLNSTVMWIENHGRHASPWNGRNNCLGLEDVCAYFADGLVNSAKRNLLNEAGVRTAIELTADKPTAINYIQGVAKVPAGFEEVAAIEFAPGRIVLVSPQGVKVALPVRHEFLKTGKL